MSAADRNADVISAARRRFLAGERIEMGTLAEQLELNRVTVYRSVGSREQLLVEVMWSLAEDTLNAERDQVAETGGERLVRILTNFVIAVISNPGMMRFASHEGELAMRLLTRTDAGFHPRLVRWVRDLMVEEFATGLLELPAEPDDYAYALVRVLESYISIDLITGEPPDPGRAERVLRMLLVR